MRWLDRQRVLVRLPLRFLHTWVDGHASWFALLLAVSWLGSTADDIIKYLHVNTTWTIPPPMDHWLTVVSAVVFAVSPPVSILTLIGLTVYGVYRTGWEERALVVDNESKLGPDFDLHVKDMRDFAAIARDLIFKDYGNGVTTTLIATIPVDSPMRTVLGAHFPSVLINIDSWNQLVENNGIAFHEFQQALNGEVERVGCQPSMMCQLDSLLSYLTIGGGSLDELTWTVEDIVEATWVTAQTQLNHQYRLRSVASEAELLPTLGILWKSVTEVTSLPAVHAYLSRWTARQDLFPTLKDQLATIRLTHRPPDRCPLCPSSKP